MVKELLTGLQLPLRCLLAIIVASATVLALPLEALTWLKLDALMQEYGKFAGLALITSASLACVKVGVMLHKHRTEARKSKDAERSIEHALQSLDHREIGVLREFYLQELNTLEMPINDATVLGLEEKGVLQRVSFLGRTVSVGYVCPFAISSPALAIMKRNNTEGTLRSSKVATPSFMSEIQSFDRLELASREARLWEQSNIG